MQRKKSYSRHKFGTISSFDGTNSSLSSHVYGQEQRLRNRAQNTHFITTRGAHTCERIDINNIYIYMMKDELIYFVLRV